MFNHNFCLFGQVLDHQVGLKSYVHLPKFVLTSYMNLKLVCCFFAAVTCKPNFANKGGIVSFGGSIQKMKHKKQRIFSHQFPFIFLHTGGDVSPPRQAAPFP